MCGIAGMIDLAGRRPAPPDVLRAMAESLFHRGPDEDGFLEMPGVGFASRRLSIVGLADGGQPIFNEDRSIGVVFNGELFDYPEQRVLLEQKGHRFVTHCDTELLPHLWEDHGEGMFEKLRGQFAVALYDERKRRVMLGRDRFGISPLYWTRQGDWLLFASEIKGLLASGMVDPKPELRGINHLFTFFAMPGPITCFEGVFLLPAGRYLRIDLARSPAQISEQPFWTIDFPDRGAEDRMSDEKTLVDGFERAMLGAVERRLRADVPVVAYLSGGVDSTTVVALASHVRKEPIPTFTIRIDAPGLDETNEAIIAARHIGAKPTIVTVGAREVLDTFPRLVEAAESPVIDTSCAALLLLAQEVHAQGYKVTLTGEGADEWLAGYPWYKIDKLLGYLDAIPGLSLSQAARRAFVWFSGVPKPRWDYVRRTREAVGGHNPWLDIYGLVSLNKLRFFSPWLQESLADHIPYEDLGFDVEKLKRWDPLNRALFFGIRVHLAGLLLNAKGDRVAMHSSVEARYPFLDEEVFDFLAKIAPRWKLRGFEEKYLLRRLADRWLPHSISRRKKAMFRAPLDTFFTETATGQRGPMPAYIEQLLSEESLKKTGYFDPASVRHWLQRLPTMRAGRNQRTSLEMGLVGVLSTQLWHHQFLGGGLADLPNAEYGARATSLAS